MAEVALIALALIAAPCPQNPAFPSCVTVQKAQAATALACVVADLPECLEGRYLDTQQADVDKAEAAGKLDSAITRADELARLLDTVQAPPVIPWYERPSFVGPIAVAATLAALAWAGRL